MCGIIITKDLAMLLEHFDSVVYTRWVDSVGIIDVWTNKWYKTLPSKITNVKEITSIGTQQKIDSMVNGIKKWAKKEKTVWPYVFHNRKASIGSISVDNAHPFKMDWFLLLQNGTNKLFHDWAMIESIIDEDMKDIADKSDTYALAKCIEKYPDKKEEILKAAVWVIVIVTKDHIEIYSDGARDFWEYIDENTNIYYASTEKNLPDSHMVGKLVLNKALEPIKELSDYKFVVKTKPATPIYHAPLNTYRNMYDDFYDDDTPYSRAANRYWYHQPYVIPPQKPERSYQDDYYLTKPGSITAFPAKSFRKHILSLQNFKSVITTKAEQSTVWWQNVGMKEFVKLFGSYLDKYNWDYHKTYASYKAFLDIIYLDD